MQLEILVDGSVRSVIQSSISITRASGGKNSTASFQIDLAPAAWNILPGDAVIIRDVAGTPVLFTGTVAKIGRALLGPTEARYTLTCVDYASLLASVVVTKTYGSSPPTSDQAVIVDLFATYLPGITTSAVDVVEADIDISFEGITLREALQRIAELTGAEWYVDANKDLHYYTSPTNPAQFSLSDTPNYSTSFPYTRNPQYDVESTMLCNRIVVQGGVDTGATATVEHPASQALYGIKEKLVIDRSLTTNAQCAAFGQAYLDLYALPQESGSITYRHGTIVDGDIGNDPLLKTLDVGQYLTIVSASHALNDTFVVRTLNIRQRTDTITEFTATWGNWRPDMTRAVGNRDRIISDIQQYQQTLYDSLVTQIANVAARPFILRCLLPGTLAVGDDVLATTLTIPAAVTLATWGISCRPEEQPTQDVEIDVCVWENLVGEWRSIFFDQASPPNGTPIHLQVESPIGIGQHTGTYFRKAQFVEGDRLRVDVLAGEAEDVEFYLKGVFL